MEKLNTQIEQALTIVAFSHIIEVMELRSDYVMLMNISTGEILEIFAEKE